MIQPDFNVGGTAGDDTPPLVTVGCLGRIVAYQETGDGRYLVTLTGIARFTLEEELETVTPYRIGRISVADFTMDFDTGCGESAVDREGLVKALRIYLDANDLEARLGEHRPGLDGGPGQRPVDDESLRSGGKTGAAGSAGPAHAGGNAGGADGSGSCPARGRRRHDLAIGATAWQQSEQWHPGRVRRPGSRRAPMPETCAMATDTASGTGSDSKSEKKPGSRPESKPETGPESGHVLDRKLLELLVCPLTKTTLEYDAERQELISRAAKLAYPIRDGIPIMLPDEARTLDDAATA